MIAPTNYKHVFLLIAAFLGAKSAQAEDTFENSTNLCSQRCQCQLTDDNLTLYINCTDQHMVHTLANWPEHPNNLVALFSYNKITTLEKMPGSSANDVKLVFANCGIEYLQTGLFESIVNIKYLDLSHNLIESEQLSSDVFKGPYNDSVYEPIALEHLDLAYNKIHSLQKKIFDHTPQLKFLSLEGNSMRIIDHITCLALSKATQMQILSLAHNMITEIPSDAIKHFPNLTELDLSYNELDFVPQSLGYVAASLQSLKINNNPIIEFEHNTFEGMENLLVLYSNNLDDLTEVGAKAFTPLRRLKVLELAHCKKLNEISDVAFEEMDELQEVYLNDNALKEISPDLLNWPQLHILDIRNNQFMCHCDLYNISTKLPSALKTDRDGPFCLDPRSYESTEIYSLTEDICNLKPSKGRRKGAPYVHGNLRIMRITLTTLIVVLIVATSVAMWLGYAKWRTYQRSLNYPFPNQVIYSPIATTEFPRF